MKTLFINRQQELSSLMSFLNDRTRSALLVVGVGGIGKTSLVMKFGDMAAQEFHWVHYIRFRDISSSEDLVDQIIETLSSGKGLIGRDINIWKRELTIDPQNEAKIGRILRFPLAGDSVQTFNSLLRSIANQFQDKKLVIIFDGIDELRFPEETISVIGDIISAVSDPIKFVFSSREMPWLDRLTRFPQVSSLSLESLSPYHSHDFLRAYLPDLDISEQVIDELVNRSQGNPLFLRLIAEVVEDAGERQGDIISQFNSVEDIFPSIDELYESRFGPIFQEKVLQELFKAIAVLYPEASIAEIKALTGLTDIQIGELVNEAKLITKSLHQDRITAFRFVHKSIQEYFVRTYILPEGFDPTKIDFGAEEAERDKLLQNNFQFKQAIDEITSGQKTIIVGDRGSGKSSIFRFLSHFDEFHISPEMSSRHLSQIKNSIVIASDDPASFIHKNGMTLSGDTNSSEQFKAFWLLFVAVLAGTEVLSQGNYLNSEDWEKLKSSLKKMKRVGIIDDIDGLQENLFEKIVGYVTKIDSKISLSIAGLPISISPSVTQPNVSNNKFTIDIAILLELINQIAADLDQNILVALDKIDEVFKYERPKQEALIRGLFLAESYLNRFSNLSLIIFLRTDLYQIYDIQEKNKLVSRSLNLEWNYRELFTLLLDRLRANNVFKQLDSLLEIRSNDTDQKIYTALKIIFPEQLEGRAFREWLLNNLKNGNAHISPRQIILFLLLLKELIIASDTSSEPFPIFKSDIVKKAMSKLSELSYGEVLSDFRVSPTLIRNLRAGKIKEFTLDEVLTLFDVNEGTVAQQVELLEKLGFLGRVIYTKEGKGYSPKFRVPDLYTRCWDLTA